MLEVGPARVAPSDIGDWLDEARPEEEFSLDRSVSVVLRWSTPILVSVVGGAVRGASRIKGPGLYAIYRPDKTLRYIGKSHDLHKRFESRFRVLWELGVPDFSFRVYTATVTETAPQTSRSRASGLVVKRTNADPRKGKVAALPLERADAARTLAEMALLRHFVSLPGNRQPLEPIYRDAAHAKVDITLNVVNENAPTPIPRAKLISILAKPSIV